METVRQWSQERNQCASEIDRASETDSQGVTWSISVQKGPLESSGTTCVYIITINLQQQPQQDHIQQLGLLMSSKHALTAETEKFHMRN